MIESCVSNCHLLWVPGFDTASSPPRIADLVLRKNAGPQFRCTKYFYYGNLMARANIPDPLHCHRGSADILKAYDNGTITGCGLVSWPLWMRRRRVELRAHHRYLASAPDWRLNASGVASGNSLARDTDQRQLNDVDRCKSSSGEPHVSRFRSANADPPALVPHWNSWAFMPACSQVPCDTAPNEALIQHFKSDLARTWNAWCLMAASMRKQRQLYCLASSPTHACAVDRSSGVKRSKCLTTLPAWKPLFS